MPSNKYAVIGRWSELQASTVAASGYYIAIIGLKADLKKPLVNGYVIYIGAGQSQAINITNISSYGIKWKELLWALTPSKSNIEMAARERAEVIANRYMYFETFTELSVYLESTKCPHAIPQATIDVNKMPLLVSESFI